MDVSNKSAALDEIELQLFAEGVFSRYGVDFLDYAQPPLNRRIWNAMHAEGLTTISELQSKVLRHHDCLDRFVRTLSVNTAGMFCDPDFYLAFRNKVVPLLHAYPFIRVWCAGCSSGEEAYSMAIVLQEEGIYDRFRIYATDINGAVVEKGQAGIFPLTSIEECSANYIKAGGKASFSDYYTTKYENAILRPSLKEDLVFSQHDLATDGPFHKFNVILCRNVMTYFNETLQERALDLFHGSLVPFGILGLGSEESLTSTTHEKNFEPLDAGEKLYRRIG